MQQFKSQSAVEAEVDVRHIRNRRFRTRFTNATGFRLSLCVASLLISGSLSSNPSTGFAWQQLAVVPNQQLAAIPHPALNLSPSLLADSSDSVSQLIELLDSPAFSQRQTATVSIIEHGVSALPDLSQRFFDSSPETNYRIRKALEGIAAAGNEETFLKSSAILLTLYANGNEQIFEQIKTLQAQWQTKRTEIAIEALRKTGAEVVQQKGYNARLGQRLVTVMPRGGLQAVISQPLEFEKRTISEQKEMVQTILASDVESNRDFIFELMPRQARVKQTLAIGAINPNLPHLAGTRIVFPTDWAQKNTDTRPIKELRQIDDRLFVEFANTNLSTAQWKTLSTADNIVALSLAVEQSSDALPTTLPASLQALTLTGFEIGEDFPDAIQRSPQLQQVQLNNCDFDERSAKRIDGINSIKNVVCQFENRKLDADIVLAMAEFVDLRTLNLTGVELSAGALQNLRQLTNVSLLYVSDMPASSSFFQSVSVMPQLKNIQFRGCKLDIAAYKKLASAQRIRMNFEAQAFLGIQGSGGINGRRVGADALVTMVVPDSAAAVGGIEAGDFINKIDGEKVNDFNDVRLHITQYTAGDEVDIEVLRDGKPKALTVKLRDYKTARKF